MKNHNDDNLNFGGFVILINFSLCYKIMCCRTKMWHIVQ